MLRPLLTLSLAWTAAPLAAQVDLGQAPQDGRLYPRELTTGTATAPVTGAVTLAAQDRLHLVVRRDGAPWWSGSVDLAYAGGSAPFAFQPVIEAGLHDYRFTLHLEASGQSQPVWSAEHVVCGDAFLVCGQSNAVASDYHNENLANRDQSPWVRSFGTASLSAAAVVADHEWRMAEGEEMYGPGAVGAWALRAGRLLVERFGVPVALINGAVGGTVIQAHQRDDADPENLNTIYGRLLYRAREAGVDLNARAMLWHQGESDGANDPVVYFDRFTALRDDWLEDYPSLEQLFVFQIRKGCAVPDMDIREAQRRFGDLFPDLTVLPTAGIDAHDGCHFYTEGYQRMGEWMAAAVAARLHGLGLPPEAAPPNVREARFTSAARDRIELVFRDPAQEIVLEPGIEARLKLRDGVAETVVQATAARGRVFLQLSGPTAATRVAYIGQALEGPWILNRRGVGAFTFEIPILP